MVEVLVSGYRYFLTIACSEPGDYVLFSCGTFTAAWSLMHFVRCRSHITHMSWAKFAIEALLRGETVQIRPRGHSMRGKVNDGDLVTLEPCDPTALQPDDIVLVKVRGRDYLHLIKAMNGGRFQIGNNRGHINGWVGHNCIYGRATKVER
jgi:hypothetical protein